MDDSKQNPRPLAVSLGLVVFVATEAPTLVHDAIRGNWQSLSFCIYFGTMLAIVFVLGWFIFCGRNWARWLLLVIGFAGFCIFLPWFIEHYSSHSASWIALSCLQNLADIVVLVAFFLPSSNRWFRRLPPNTALEPL